MAATAEIARVARLLRCEPRELKFLGRFDAGELRALRLAVVERLDADQRATYSRMAAASRLLPIRVVVPVTERVMPARVAAGVVASLPPERAAAMGSAMSTEYVADVTPHLAPSAVQPVLSRMPVEVVLQVAGELHRRGDYDAMAEIVAALTDEQVTAVLTSVGDAETMVEVALRVTDPAAVQRLVGVLPEARLQEMVRWARRRARLWPELVTVLDRLPQAQRRRLLSAPR